LGVGWPSRTEVLGYFLSSLRDLVSVAGWGWVGLV
jgi:hypothetical protein